MRYRTRLLAASAIGAILSCTGPALAQDASATTPAPAPASTTGAASADQAVPPAPSTAAAPVAAQSQSTVDNGDIVITAQRRAQNLQKTPIAVTAFNPEMLQVRGMTDVKSLASSTPGLYLTQATASPSALQIEMRGAQEQNGGTITSESPVAIYIDDVYQSRLSAADFDLADIARIEVLRGPQGTLYGRNSMTGAIKLITRAPNGENWLTTDVSYASFQEVRAKVTAGAPLGDHLAFAASAFYDDRNKGWQYDLTTHQDVSKYERFGGQLALGITNVPGLEAVVEARYVRNNSDGQHFLPINEANFQPAVPFYDTLTPVPAIGDDSETAVSMRLGYDFGGIKLRSISAYQHLSQDWALDFSGGYTLPGGAIVPGFYRHALIGEHQVTQEFQALGKGLDNKLNYIVGLYYYDEKAHETNLDNLAAFGLTYVPETLQMHSRSLAAYAQADYEIIPGLTASAGIRYTADHKWFNGTTQNGFIPVAVPVAHRVNANVWTPRFNLQYDINPHAMVYVNASRGYRAAGFNSLVIGDPADFGAPYQPEFAWSYEVGAKFDAFDRLLRMNIAAYDEKLTNLQTLAVAGGGSFIIQNAAKSTVEGVELETTLTPARNLSFFGNLTYTYDKYDQLDPGSQAAQTHANRLPLISRWQYQVGGSYDLPLGGSGSLQFAGDYSWRSAYNSLVSLSAASENPAFGRANATITYKSPGDHYEIYGQATNLFNSKDWFGSAEFIPGVFGYKIPLEPRVWRIGFRYKM